MTSRGCLPHARSVREEVNEKKDQLLLHFETDYTFSVNLCMFFGIEYLIMFAKVVFVVFFEGISFFFFNKLICLLEYSSLSITLVEIVCMIADMLFIRIVVPGIVIN